MRVGLLGRGETNWAGAGNWAVVGSGLGRKGRLDCLRFSWFGFGSRELVGCRPGRGEGGPQGEEIKGEVGWAGLGWFGCWVLGQTRVGLGWV